MPRGGARPGAGRKPKAPHLRGIDGGAGRRGSVVEVNQTAQPDAPASPPPVDPPADDITTVPDCLKPASEDPETVAQAAKVIKVWEELAPLAHKARTLIPGTVLSLTLLCRLVVLERKLSSIAAGGSEHRGTLQRLNALMLQFQLTPNGKPMYEAPKATEKPKTGLSRFRAS